MQNAYGEMRKVDMYQYVIVNDDVDRALRSSMHRERRKLRTVRFLPTIEED